MLLFPELGVVVFLLHHCILNIWPAVTAFCNFAVKQPVESLHLPSCAADVPAPGHLIFTVQSHVVTDQTSEHVVGTNVPS